MYGVINFSRIDTTPGLASAFSPPAGFAGDYRAYLVQRMKADKGVHQHVATAARMHRQGSTPPTYVGPYADIARELMQTVLAKMHASACAEKAKREASADPM